MLISVVTISTTMIFQKRDGNDDCPTKRIINQIWGLKSYVLEDAFGQRVETDWQSICQSFINETLSAVPIGSDSIRRISDKTAQTMVEMYIIMACRNPSFDCFELFPKAIDMLRNAMLLTFETTPEAPEDRKIIDANLQKINRSVWLAEIYRALYREQTGVFSTLAKSIPLHCQMILYKVESEAEGCFITSDNPAFRYISSVDRRNKNGFFFPLTPNYLLMMGRSSEMQITDVLCKSVSNQDIKEINRIILNTSVSTVIANRKHLGYIL